MARPHAQTRFFEPLLRGRPVDGANASFAMGYWAAPRTRGRDDGQDPVLHVDSTTGAVQELVGCITYSMHPNPDASGQFLVESSECGAGPPARAPPLAADADAHLGAPTGSEVCYIMTLGVAPRFRRRGLASDMLRRTILHAETRGAGLVRVSAARPAHPASDPPPLLLPAQIHLHVIVTNPVALGFYQKHGFQLLDVAKGALTAMPGEALPGPMPPHPRLGPPARLLPPR